MLLVWIHVTVLWPFATAVLSVSSVSWSPSSYSSISSFSFLIRATLLYTELMTLCYVLLCSELSVIPILLLLLRAFDYYLLWCSCVLSEEGVDNAKLTCCEVLITLGNCYLGESYVPTTLVYCLSVSHFYTLFYVGEGIDICAFNDKSFFVVSFFDAFSTFTVEGLCVYVFARSWASSFSLLFMSLFLSSCKGGSGVEWTLINCICLLLLLIGKCYRLCSWAVLRLSRWLLSCCFL